MLHRHTELPGGAPAFAERAAAWLRTGLLLTTVFSAGFYLCWTAWPTPAPAAPQANTDPQDPWSGKRHPAALSPEIAAIPEDAEVIGVVVGGHARAYLIQAVAGHILRHVVNDMVGDYPVSVAYCDRTNCTQVFTGPPTGAPLNVPYGFWTDEHGMVFRIDGVDYAQKTGANLTAPDGPAIPFEKLPYVRTNWRDWREAHPDTDIFTGYFQADYPQELTTPQ
jgi:hypothetical protein